MSNELRTGLAAVLAVILGIAAWEVVMQASTRREAWDDPNYWLYAFPAMIAGSAILGWLAPEKPWRWGLLVGLGQGVWSLLKASIADGVPNLLPLGLIAFAVMSLPCIAAAYAGAWVARRG